MGKKTFDVGTLVEVYYDPSDRLPNIAAKKFNGTKHRIVRRIDYGSYGTLLELDGAVSDKGMPYVFTVNDLKIV